MKTFRLLALALAALLLSSAPAFAATIRGVWEFSNPAALGAGQTLPGGVASPTLTVEGTAPSHTASLGDGTTTLSGVITTVAGPANRLRLTHGIAPNGGSVSVVRQYSLLFDVFSPAGSRDAWRSFFQTAPGNNNDGDYFIGSTNNQIGTGELGYTTSELDEAHWARVVIVVDLPSVKVYVNGALFHTHFNQDLNGRYALESQLLLFADENGENAALHVGAVAMWSGALTGSEVAALSGPGAVNIGVNRPPRQIVVEQPAGTELGAAGVLAWGNNGYGQTTVPAGAQSGVAAIAAGHSHTVALKSNGSVVAWGNNGYGQTTVPAGAQSGVTAIAAGAFHTLALKSNGSVLAWGRNNSGQTTVPAGAQSGVIAIAAGHYHTVALKSDGSVLAWGYNADGQTTVPVGAQSGVTAIAAGEYFTMALKSNGSVVAWGLNTNGQTTVPAEAQTGVTAIAAGYLHTLALKSNGSVVAWGRSTEGQTTVPTRAQSGVIAIAAGAYFTMALKSDGSVVAWGDNFYGQTTVPAGAQSGVTAIAAGAAYNVALVASAPPTFASQVNGTTSAAKSFVVKNTGTAALALSGASVTGGQAGDFAVNTTGMLTSVPAGGQTTFSVTFTPSAAGARATTLRIVNDDPDENPFDIALTGTGIVDTTAPETTITSANPTPVSSTARTITFTGTDNGAVTSFEGRLDGAAFATVTSPVSLSGLGGGSHTYEVRARDTAGNVDATPASVTWVVDTTPPTLSLPGNLTKEATGATGAVVTYTASASDAGSGLATSSFTPASGSTFAITTTTVNASATDNAGNMASGSFTVTVQDTTAPTVTVPGNITVAATSTGGAAVTFAVSASDLVDGAVAATATPASGSTFPIGDTTVLVTALDSRGNSGSGSFLVKVTSAPEIVVDQPAGTELVGGAPRVLAWGRSTEGQTTVPAGAQSGVTAIAAGYSHTVALKSNGSVVVWGYNGYGQTTVPAGAQSGVTAIAAGGDHTVALKSTSSVLAWGRSTEGQTTVPAGAQSGVTAIAAGAFHTVALKSNGSVLAWGYNNYGQTTVPAGAQSGVTAIAAGGFHTVALKSNGSVVAWGDINYGQTTVPAGAQSGVTAIAAGGSHTVALKSNGSVLAWGGNSYGQTTVPAGAQSGVIAIAAGAYYTVALKSDGSVLAWGENDFGQTTVPAGAQSGGTAIAAGGLHTVALVPSAPTVIFTGQPSGTTSAAKSFVVKNTGTGALALSGVSVTDGNAGDFSVNTTGMLASVPAGGQTTFSVTFTPSALGTRATTLRIVSDDANENPFDIALIGTGIVDTTPPETSITSANPTPVNSTTRTITFTGTDDVAVTSYEGRLDGAAFATVTSPVTLSGLANGSHTYEVRAKDAAGNVDATPASVTWVVTTAPEIAVEQPAGTPLALLGVVAWGYNDDGQATVPAGAQSGVTAIAAAFYHTVALKSDGSVLAWGGNSYGQTTVPAEAQSGVTAIAAAETHTVALKSNGSVLAWGDNSSGQTTVPAGAQSGVTAIAAGIAHTVALKSDGSVLAWGSNGFGETTVPVGAQSGVVAIAAGENHTVALKSDGSVVAWGYNGNGQTTVPAGAQSGVMAIAAGAQHTVALKSNGSVVAWGDNGNGQTTVPAGAQSGVTAIAAGFGHTVALKSDGSMLAWGANGFGQTTVPAGAQTGVVAIAAGGFHTVALVASAPTVTFASQALGSPSAAKSFVVKNTGTAALALSGVSVTGGQAGDFAVNTTGMLASVPAGGQTTFSVVFTPSAAGARATTLRIVNDDANENPFDIALTGTGQGVFPAWATANGVANDPQALGANGLENRLNFAFAIHPVTGGPGPLQYAGPLAGGGTIAATGLPITVMEPGDRRVLFVRRKDHVAAGLTYTPQFSSTLATWQASDEPTVLADDGVNQIVSVPYPALGPGETRSFFRVTVSLAP